MSRGLEYHLFARFPSNGGAVRIAVTFSERAAQRLGNELWPWVDEIYYRIKARHPNTKPYRRPRPRLTFRWRATL